MKRRKSEKDRERAGVAAMGGSSSSSAAATGVSRIVRQILRTGEWAYDDNGYDEERSEESGAFRRRAR